MSKVELGLSIGFRVVSGQPKIVVTVSLTVAVNNRVSCGKEKCRTQNKMEEMYMDKIRRPVREIRSGFVRGTIWFNKKPGRRGWYSVTITRVYVRGGYYLQDTSSLRYDNLRDVLLVVINAGIWIWWQGVSLSRKRR